MATTSNVKILYGEDDQLNKLHIGVASGTVLARGDFLKYSTGAVTAVAASTDNEAFIGVSLDLSRSGDTADVNVLLKGRLNVGVTSATYVVGEALTYATGANGTDWTFASVSSGADGMIFSLQYKASAVTVLDVHINSFLIGTSLGGGSGVWEGFAS